MNSTMDWTEIPAHAVLTRLANALSATLSEGGET